MDGACVQMEDLMTDADTAYDYNPSSEIFVAAPGDACNGTEFVLENETGSYENVNCPAGMACGEGRCIGQPVSCQELVPGMNNALDASRINIVFVGADYHELYPDHAEAVEKFSADALHVTGINGDSYLGAFDIEPFRSHQNFFNFWYVDQFADNAPAAFALGSTLTPEEQAAETARKNEARISQRGIASACDVPKRLSITLHAVRGWYDASGMNIDFATYRDMVDEASVLACVSDITSTCISAFASATGLNDNPIVDLNGDGCYSPDELVGQPILASTIAGSCSSIVSKYKVCPFSYPEAQSVCEIGSLIGTGLAHELAHVFGYADEWPLSDSALMPPVDILELDNAMNANCFVASSREECLENAPWQGFIGDGCGVEGVEDCLGLVAGQLETTCFEGCLPNIHSYRSIADSIMPYGLARVPIQEVYPGGSAIYPLPTLGEWGEFMISHFMNAYYAWRPPANPFIPLNSPALSPSVGGWGRIQPAVPGPVSHEWVLDTRLGSGEFIENIEGSGFVAERIALSLGKPFKTGHRILDIAQSGSAYFLRLSNTLTVTAGGKIKVNGVTYRVSTKGADVVLTKDVSFAKNAKGTTAKKFSSVTLPARSASATRPSIWQKIITGKFFFLRG
ncbi:hypothetical protein HY501_00325 [Candidatus Woesearchaeota archaeon]|nr:hypothetical protein [Candidatus Woesearchaeota archaeon]